MEGVYVRPNGNVFWLVKKSKDLQTLHTLALKYLQPLTGGLLMDQMQHLLQGTSIHPKERKLIKKFGGLLVAKHFVPHLTLCQMTDNKDKENLISILIPQIYTWKCEEYQIGKLRPDGSVSEIIDTQKLKTHVI